MTRAKNKARRNQQANVHSTANPLEGQHPAQNYGTQAISEPSQNGYTQKGEYGGVPTLTGVDIYALVDSWRSYKNDTTNLQTTTSAQSRLNAAATDFVPTSGLYTSQISSYAPYQPLRSVHNYARYPSYRVNKHYRVSDGNAERKVLENARSAMYIASAKPLPTNGTQPSAGFAGRYPSRSNRRIWDQPLASIEGGADDNAYASIKSVKDLQSVRYRSRTPGKTASPTAPETTEAYRAEANKSPVRLSEPRKLLVVLDLNGTLLYRGRPASTGAIHMRPGVTTFLRYLFDNHVVMVYTSAMPQGADRMVKHFLHPNQRNQLAALWARDKLDLSKDQFHSKVQVYKKLDKIWRDGNIQKTAGEGQRWDQTNTVLVDDSKLKALAQPHNLVQVPEYTKADMPKKSSKKKGDKHTNKVQQDIMKQLELKLEELRYQEDVSRLIRKWQTGEVDVPRLPGQEVVVEETVDQKVMQGKRSDSTDDEIEVLRNGSHLPTPQSMADDNDIERPMEISEDEDEDGGVATSDFATISQKPSPEQVTGIPGLGGLIGSDNEDCRNERLGERSVSPIDESVFKELLEDAGR
ncbi:hypothetical protein H2198_000764 [Neophaeococcomyces mojaviensis]|uniref:Uncharacterized protein n=1 Tax=Neophaeococcomyces mojaviensis TaxID=3383035 RepID=A0ACC3AJF3_9EURO|nr:hypothetical protein H2198_000764 [Knufia sp. JES_112]